MFGWALEPSVAEDSDYDPPARRARARQRPGHGGRPCADERRPARRPTRRRPATARPTSATSRPRPAHAITETIDEIPMGGVPEPGVAPTVDTGEERTHLTDMPEETADRDTHGGHATTTGHLQQQAGDVAVPRLGVPAVRRPDQHVHAVPGPPLRRPRAGPDLRHPVHVGVELRAADELADDGAGRVVGGPRRRAQHQAVAVRHGAARRHVRRRPGLRVHDVLPGGPRASRRACSRPASTRSPASTAPT